MVEADIVANIRSVFSSTRPRSLANIVGGSAVANGRAGMRDGVTAPISSKTVIAYRVTVEVLIPDEIAAFQKRPWRRVLDRAEGSDFELRDTTSSASVLVRPPTFLVALGGTTRKSLVVPPKAVERLLESVNMGMRPRSLRECFANPRDKHVRWREVAIQDGQQVWVAGEARLEQREGDAERSDYRQSRSRPVFSAERDRPLVVSNCAGDSLPEFLEEPDVICTLK